MEVTNFAIGLPYPFWSAPFPQTVEIAFFQVASVAELSKWLIVALVKNPPSAPTVLRKKYFVYVPVNQGVLQYQWWKCHRHQAFLVQFPFRRRERKNKAVKLTPLKKIR